MELKGSQRMKRLWLVCRSATLMGTFLLAVWSAAQHKTAPAKKTQADEQSWMQQCKSRGSNLSDSQCSLWVRRKEFVHKASCPDQDQSIGCSSFQELVKADDPDMMLDLAQQDHVYVCFRPQQDVFLEIYFNDPNDGTWQPDDRFPNTANLAGWAEVRYFKDGIVSAPTSFHNSGKWIYHPAPGTNLSELRVPNGNAIFESDNIRITGSTFDAAQTYKNESNLTIHHILTVQLSTGRFTESYEMQPSGESVDNFSGRCFVLPTATH
jgi:hypothetical protein